MEKLLACLVFLMVWSPSVPYLLLQFPLYHGFLFTISGASGHGGSRAAEYLKQHLFENLMKHPEFLTDTKLAISNFSLGLFCTFFLSLL
jgi:hypothetical protein